MEWDKIETFYHVAKAKSFSAAGEQIYISQSALSRSVAKLENQLGKKLFIRSKNGLIFTREGETLFKLAEKMILDVNATKKIIQGDDKNIEGELKILTSPSLASDWLPFLIGDFLKEYPKIKLKIVGEITARNYYAYDVIIQPILSQHPDFIQESLLSSESDLFANPDFTHEFLYSFKPICLFASKKYIEEFGKPETVSDLDNHQLLCFSEDINFPYDNTTWILRVGKKAGRSRKAYMTINESRGLFHAVKEGMGIAQLACGYPEAFNADLVNILPDLQGPSTNIYFAYDANLKEFKKIIAFKDFLMNKLQKTN